MKELYIRAYSQKHGQLILDRLTELQFNTSDRAIFSTQQSFPAYMRTFNGSVYWGPLHLLKQRVGPHAEINTTLDDLFDPDFLRELEAQREVKITVELNGKKISPKDISEETWNTLRDNS